MTMEYKLVLEQTGPDLEDSVNKWIAKGWKPLGGVAVSTVQVIKDYREYRQELPEWEYAQAMTFET
jgi:hypothetical protein